MDLCVYYYYPCIDLEESPDICKIMLHDSSEGAIISN